MPDWLPVVITIALFIVGIYNGIIGYFLNQHMKRVDDLEKKHEALQKDLQDFKQQVPIFYIRQDEFVRYQTALNQKLDKIHDMVWKLTVKAAVQEAASNPGGEERGESEP